MAAGTGIEAATGIGIGAVFWPGFALFWPWFMMTTLEIPSLFDDTDLTTRPQMQQAQIHAAMPTMMPMIRPIGMSLWASNKFEAHEPDGLDSPLLQHARCS